MADATDYIHPIIQAMVDSANLKSRAIGQQNQSDQEREQAKNRRDELALAVNRAKEESRLNDSRLDLQRQQYKQAQDEFIAKTHHDALADISTGLQPVEGLKSAPTIPTALNSQPGAPNQTVTPSPASVAPAPNFSQMPAPGPADSQDGNVDVGGTSMPRAVVAQIPQNVAKIAGQRAQAVAEAQDAAKLPNQAAATKAAQDREDARDKANYDRAIAVARITANSNHDRGEMLLLGRIMAMNGGMPVDPDVANSKYNSILDGQTGYATLSKGEKDSVDKIAAMRGTSLPTNQSAYSKKLDQSVAVQKLLDQYRDLATNFSSDSPNQPDAGLLDKTVKGAQQIPLVGRFINPAGIPGTDIQSKVADLKSQAGQLAGYFDQNNRKSDQEIQRSFNGVFDPRSTMKQNLAKLEDHLKLVRASTKSNFAGINPQDVENVLSNRGAHDLLPSMNSAGSKPLTDATMHQILIEAHGDPKAALQLAIQRGYEIPKGPQQ